MPGASKLYSQEELLGFIEKKDKAAFGVLYDTYSPVIYSVISKLTSDPDRLEDILQKTFIKIWQNIPEYEPSKKRLLAWMLLIARDVADDVLQNINKNSKIQKSNNNVINSKEVLSLIYFRGYSLKNAADALNISVEELRLKLKMELDLIRTAAVK